MTDQSILEEGVDLGSLERQVIQADLELKRQELDHRSREQSNRDLEIELKRASAAASRWTSPLVVAVFAAAVAGLSNATVSIINGRSTRNLEESKSESERILEVIKTGGDTEKAAENLRFLIRSGLVSSHPTVDYLRKYLSNRKPGTGVTLPSVSDTFTIKKSPAIAETVRSDLSSRLGYFVAYLAKIGFQPPSSKIDITFLKNEEINDERKLRQ